MNNHVKMNKDIFLETFFLILDIDECSTTKPCQQKCKNTPGSFLCSCNVGYQVDPTNSNKCTGKDSLKYKQSIIYFNRPIYQ